MKKTFAPKKSDIKTSWVLIDAKNKILGKVAAEAAVKLAGKHKAIYTPNAQTGDKVVVINAEKAVVTGDKATTKAYVWHTGYPKGLRHQTLKDLMQKKPTEALRRAIKGMLPKNKLQKERMTNLYIYVGEEHPHKANLEARKV